MTPQHVPFSRPPPERCLRPGVGWVGGCAGVGWGEGAFHLLQALKSLSSSDPWVTHWAGSCLAFSNANDEQRWKPQIGPCNSACGVWWGPAHVGDRGLSPASHPPSPPGLLCAAVIGTDVPLASHRATFPLIATLYADSFHLPQQLPLSPFSSLPLQFSPHPFLHFSLFFAQPPPRPLRDGLPWCPPKFLLLRSPIV